MDGVEIVGLRVMRVGAATIEGVQTQHGRAGVHGPAQESVQFALAGRRLHEVRLELVAFYQLHEVRPPIACVHRFGQIAPDGVLLNDDAQLDLVVAHRGRR